MGQRSLDSSVLFWSAVKFDFWGGFFGFFFKESHVKDASNSSSAVVFNNDLISVCVKN